MSTSRKQQPRPSVCVCISRTAELQVAAAWCLLNQGTGSQRARKARISWNNTSNSIQQIFCMRFSNSGTRQQKMTAGALSIIIPMCLFTRIHFFCLCSATGSASRSPYPPGWYSGVLRPHEICDRSRHVQGPPQGQLPEMSPEEASSCSDGSTISGSGIAA